MEIGKPPKRNYKNVRKLEWHLSSCRETGFETFAEGKRMGQSLAINEIRKFLEKLARQYSQPFHLYLLGGSAMCFLGSQRRTVDIDCTIETMPSELVATIDDVARELQMESVHKSK
jgi:hypothetical protein